jgi:hypothetical protein
MIFRHGFARYSFSSVPVGRPFRADFDGALSDSFEIDRAGLELL